MHQRLAIFFILILINGCRSETDSPLTYFNKLSTIYQLTEAEIEIYIQKKNSTLDTIEKNHLRKKIEREITYSIEKTKRVNFSENDFGLKKAILQDYFQALRIARYNTHNIIDTNATIDNMIFQLDSFSKKMDYISTKSNQNLMRSQKKFISYYKIHLEQNN